MSISYDVVTQSGVSKVTSQAVLRDLEEDDLEGAFTIHVTHGHLIRSLIHVLRDILAYGILELTPTTLRLLRLDKTERVIVSIEIDTSRFFQYLFVSRRGVIRIGISFAVLWQCIKVIGKQDSFIMSKCDGEDYVILDFGTAARQQYALQGVCEQHIEIPVYLSRQPNVYITVKELTKAMSYLRTERGRAHIMGYRDRIIVASLNGKKVQRMGVSFEDVWKRIGMSPDQLVGKLKANPGISCSLHLNSSETCLAELEISQQYQKYGAQGSAPTVDAVQSHLALKSLSKVYTIAPNSSILATVESGKPIRLVIPIGEYGHLTLFLLSSPWTTTVEEETLPSAVSSEPSLIPTIVKEESIPKKRHAANRRRTSPPPVEETTATAAVLPQPPSSSSSVPAPRPSRRTAASNRKKVVDPS